MNIYKMLMLTSLATGNISQSHGHHDKMITSNQEDHFDTLERWGFKLEGPYHSSNEDPVIPKGGDPCFFMKTPCHLLNKEQKNELPEGGWTVVRYYESMNIPLKASTLEEILNKDSNIALTQ